MIKQLLPIMLLSAGSGPSTAQTPSHPKQDSPFACNLSAFTPAARKRHGEVGSALRARKRSIRELGDGFAFEFPSDAATFQLVTEWVAGERLCCPFFDFAIRLDREEGPLWLHLSGREGVKDFVRAELAPWFPK